MLAHEGTLLIASWFGDKPVQLPLGGAFHRRRLTIRSTQVSTIPAPLSAIWTVARRRAEAAALLPELPLAELCTHVFPFAHAADAFRAVDENTPGLMHAVLDYDGEAHDDASGGLTQKPTPPPSRSCCGTATRACHQNTGSAGFPTCRSARTAPAKSARRHIGSLPELPSTPSSARRFHVPPPPPPLWPSELALPTATDEDFRETDFGEWEGLTIAEIQKPVA